MKIEMGESLLYSWLRHKKKCQVVQTNWTPVGEPRENESKSLEKIWESTEDFFKECSIYDDDKEHNFSKFLKQAEIDVVGICLKEGDMKGYAVEVAFHEHGLNYGNVKETVAKVINKSIRSAICMRGYFGINKGEVIFASPKIDPKYCRELEQHIKKLNEIFQENRFGFTAEIIANDDFEKKILKPTLDIENGGSDTSELFMRGYKLAMMFKGNEEKINQRGSSTKE
jgi:hypothetical protein